jgi:iron complex outermembrane recepter protein
MAEVGTEVTAVQIQAERPLVTVKPDMLVFNVENTPNAIGENAFNLLRKAPGVVIDNNDNIMLLGKSGLRIYIDGKPSPLSAKDLATFLKSIQSNQIESFEIITNPSSKYDAQGNAGIINIKMKRDKNLGGNATVDLGYAVGLYSKYSGSVSANYRNKRFNAFGTYSMWRGRTWNFMDFLRIQDSTTFDQATEMRDNNRNNNFRAGMDFFVSKKSTIGVLTSGFISNNQGSNRSITVIAPQSTMVPTAILDAGSDMEGGNTNLNFNLNYRYDNANGTTLTADADYGFFNLRNRTYQPNLYRDPTTYDVLIDRTFTSDAPTNIDISVLKVDYEHPFLKGKLGLGAKGTYVQTDNVYSFYDLIDGVEVIDSFRTNAFDYTENVNAAYVNYQTKVKKFAFQAGLRAEQTNSLGELTALIPTNDNRVERHYLNLFPSGGVTYDLNQKNTLSLTYSRRIDRPQYQNLNPFEFKLDELSYMKGNPFLQPQYTHNIELSHTFNYTLNTSVSYARTSDFFTELIDTTEQFRSFLTTENLSTKEVATINVSYPFNVTKWWSTYTNVSAFTVRQQAAFDDGKTIDIMRSSASVFHQSNFKLPAGIGLQFGGFYNSPGIWGANFQNNKFWGLDLGAQKSFWKGKANLKLALSDVLYTMQWSGKLEYGGLYMEGRGGWESRQFRANFTYIFGNSAVKSKKRGTGLDDEKGRAGGGGGGLGR